ncbi:MAG: hypothetical protein K1X94_29100 [Sandaracinaceae bacterium]|nr:hypothetical protein [Sandaracinaceae bacterium]
MRQVLVAMVALHGLIHLVGFQKAFEIAGISAFSQPVSPAYGVLWLAAAILLVGFAMGMVAWPATGWKLGALGVIASQIAIFGAWQDTWFGTISNVVILGLVIIEAGTWGPSGLWARYQREAAETLARARALPPLPPLTEADLESLPPPVARYLRVAGWVGKPRTRWYDVSFSGRIRGAASEPWMDFLAEQQSFADTPMRLFLMSATMKGLPVHVFHRFADGHATFEVVVAGLVKIVDARGPDLDQAETVTLFNDMCLLAPSTLLSPSVTFSEIEERSVRATFEHAGKKASARLTFAEDGMLADFVSEDRLRASRDGKSFTKQRFSTPVHETKSFGPIRSIARADARWHPSEGELTYGEFEVLDLEQG